MSAGVKMRHDRPESNYRPGEERQDDNYRKEHRQGERDKDPFRGLLPGLILILLGALFFMAARGFLSWNTWWQYFLVGLGLIFLIDSLVHYLSPSYRYAAFGRLIPGVILLFVGIAFIYGWSQWWPLVLVAAGIILIISVFFRNR
jgi:uncharacterized membrane protein YjjP (DUF1212 family)